MTTFTFAPTTEIHPSPANIAVAERIDRIQAAFNMAMFESIHRTALLPISDGLYNLFVAFETGDEHAVETLEDMVDRMSQNDARYTIGMQEAIISLSDLLAELNGDGEIEF